MVRKTIQRQLVLDAVRTLKCHPTAEEVFAEINKEHPSISRATVYRNLEQLAANGDIGRVETLVGATVYDHIVQRHYHVRCVRCNRHFDVDMKVIEGLEKQVVDMHGFKIDACDLIFRGVCPNCQKIDAEIAE